MSGTAAVEDKAEVQGGGAEEEAEVEAEKEEAGVGEETWQVQRGTGKRRLRGRKKMPERARAQTITDGISALERWLEEGFPDDMTEN